MSTAAWRSIWQRPTSISDLRRLTQIAGTSSSRCPSAQEMTEAAVWRRLKPRPFSSSRGWWGWPAARKGPILTLHETARFYYPGASRVHEFGTADQRPASLSDLGRVPQISGACSSRSPSAQTMTEAAARRQPTSPTFRASGCQASAPSCIDRMPPSNLGHLQFFGTSYRSRSESAGCWQRQAACRRRMYVLRKPARLFFSGLGQARQLCTHNQQERQATKQHLYLVLDDQEKLFSIHKLDIDNLSSSSAAIPRRFSEPPLLRIGPPTIGKGTQFAALGSHIIGTTCPSSMGMAVVDEPSLGGTLTFDTKTAKLSVSSFVPRGVANRYDAAIAVRNILYVFGSVMDNEVLPPEAIIGKWRYVAESVMDKPRHVIHCLAANPNDDVRDWTCLPLFNSSQFSWSWPDNPPELLFDPSCIIAHVVDPSTGTIFMSTSGPVGRGTFSYDMGGSGRGKKLGEWVLPFKGPAHYDHKLKAWVGLHRKSSDSDDADGYLCACAVVSGLQPPKEVVGREKLFMEHTQWIHVDAKLVYMGECSKYCLVERLLPQGGDKMMYVLRLTTFVVKLGEEGELRTMTDRPACFYKAPSYRCRFDVQAFWM